MAARLSGNPLGGCGDVVGILFWLVVCRRPERSLCRCQLC
jgi:hypothetical protein